VCFIGKFAQYTISFPCRSQIHSLSITILF
jgi:hypothetical protein